LAGGNNECLFKIFVECGLGANSSSRSSVNQLVLANDYFIAVLEPGAADFMAVDLGAVQTVAVFYEIGAFVFLRLLRAVWRPPDCLLRYRFSRVLPMFVTDLSREKRESSLPLR